MNKTIIHEFDPCIYPRLLWVVKGGALEGIKETFEVECNEEDLGGAVTLPARRKSDNRLGYIVWFPKSGDIRRGDWIAHESSHVALGIFDYIGSEVEANESEPFSYLVGWVFKCVDKVRKYKEVKYGTESESSDKATADTSPLVESEKENRNG